LKVDLDLNIGSKALEIHGGRVEEEDEDLIVFLFFLQKMKGILFILVLISHKHVT